MTEQRKAAERADRIREAQLGQGKAEPGGRLPNGSESPAPWLIGPVDNIGWPFPGQDPFLVQRRHLGGFREAYTFHSSWLGQDEADRSDFTPATPLAGIVAWNPMWWPRTGDVTNLLVRWRRAGATIIGVMGDWTAGWTTQRFMGTVRSAQLCTHVLVDRYGAAALRRGCEPRHLPVIIERDELFSYGLMPTLGGDEQLVLEVPETHPWRMRQIDIGFVGNDHAGWVWERPYILEAATRAAELHGWTCRLFNGVQAAQMEQLLLDTKVCLNPMLGTIPNYRAYEALAAGCIPLTGATGYDSLPDDMARVTTCYETALDMELLLETILDPDQPYDERDFARVSRVAVDHSPEQQWISLLKNCDAYSAASPTPSAPSSTPPATSS